MRLGYGIASKEVIGQMRGVMYGSINALVKHGGAAALKDSAYEAKIRQVTRQVREETMGELRSMKYQLIPSDANFFMVNVKQDVTAVAAEFAKRGILVGRRFPPMNEWLRVTVGTPDDMKRFLSAFREIL
jgi:histidinol-phosphate aminotransferase